MRGCKHANILGLKILCYPINHIKHKKTSPDKRLKREPHLRCGKPYSLYEPSTFYKILWRHFGEKHDSYRGRLHEYLRVLTGDKFCHVKKLIQYFYHKPITE